MGTPLLLCAVHPLTRLQPPPLPPRLPPSRPPLDFTTTPEPAPAAAARRSLQGIILRRSKIPRDPKTPEAGSLAPADLCVGAQVELYGKVVLLTDADEATRKW